MNLVVVKESVAGERRVAVTPQTAQKLVRLGADVRLESGVGASLHVDDAAYVAAGATVGARDQLLAEADVLLTVQPPGTEVVAALRPGAVTVGFLDPFFNHGLVRALAHARLSSLCMELIPRTTYAQKMDALSSQASLAGYAAVVVSASRSHKAFPMMSTPAGTIAPARVFIVGAGVAGLQAIATAKRLGARVEAYDTRPVVKEQVQSLGARFVELDVGETGQTEQGYAKELTPEQLEMQRHQMAAVCAHSDVVITTAQVFGRRAPLIITEEMVSGMKPGSVIVDLAASTGGQPLRRGRRHGERRDDPRPLRSAVRRRTGCQPDVREQRLQPDRTRLGRRGRQAQTRHERRHHRRLLADPWRGDSRRARAHGRRSRNREARMSVLLLLFIFVLANFLGLELINKVPSQLHTPLMSGSNAISGITIVGAMAATAVGGTLGTVLAVLALVFATINVVGGYLVTDRMLGMFKAGRKSER